MSAAKRVALGGVLLAVALALSWAERLLPPPVPSIPGIKLGLANAVTLIILCAGKSRTERPAIAAATVAILRVLLAGLLFTGAWAMLYSLAGTLLSLAVMLSLKRLTVFSIIGVSVAGGVAHNLAQLCFAAVTLGDARLMLYYPVLIFSGIAAGAIVGFAASEISKRVDTRPAS